MSMDRTRSFYGAGYVIAVLLCIIPMLDILVQGYPPQTEDTAWRVGVASRFTASLIMPLLGLFIAAVTAHVRADTLAMRITGIVTLMLAAVICILGPFLL